MLVDCNGQPYRVNFCSKEYPPFLNDQVDELMDDRISLAVHMTFNKKNEVLYRIEIVDPRYC